MRPSLRGRYLRATAGGQPGPGGRAGPVQRRGGTGEAPGVASGRPRGSRAITGSVNYRLGSLTAGEVWLWEPPGLGWAL